MEGLILLFLVVVVMVFVVPAVALAKASRASRAIEELKQRLLMLEARLHRSSEDAPAPPPEIVTQPKPAAPIIPSVSVPPPLPVTAVPPPIPETKPIIPVEEVQMETAPPPARTIDWEQFMGAKMFAWIGGFALFLGVAFFVKYSFEHNLISPELRVAIGFLTGIALVIGGVALKRKENVVTAQTLCATGILILYAVTFACRSFYHFPFFGLIPTFALMSLITAAAFLLAVRMDALVVAILGIAGGFLTPVLLSTGQDNPFGLFGYIALLDIGLLAVARRKEWSSLPILGAVGTVLMQIAWVGNFFLQGQYFAGNKTLIPMAVFLGFEILFLVAALTSERAGKLDTAISGAALAVGAFAMLWAFYFFSFTTIGSRPVLLLSYLFLVDAALLGLCIAKKYFACLIAVVGIAAFIFLGLWTNDYLTARNLYIALGAYFVFALLHSSLPIAMQRLGKATPPWSVHLFPAATLLLVLLPIFKLATASFLVWPLVLCVDVIALLAAAMTGMLAAVAIVLVLTLVALGAWMLQIPPALTGFSSSLFLLAGFSIFFVAAAAWVSRRLLQTEKAGRTWKYFWRICRPGEFRRSASRSRRHPSISPVSHGNTAITPGKSITSLRTRASSGGVTARPHQNIFARSARLRRARFHHPARTRLAFSPFQKGRRRHSNSLVSRFHCRLHNFPIYFSSPVRSQEHRLGERGPGCAASFLSRLRRCSHDPSEQRNARSGAGRVCRSFTTRAGGIASTHSERQSCAQRSTRAFWRGRLVFHHFDFSNPIRSAMDHAWLGAGRRSIVLAISSRAASRSAHRGDRAAADFICPARL